MNDSQANHYILDKSDLMTYINFGLDLQQKVEKTNADLLEWGDANLRSPLTNLFDKAKSLCEEFSNEMNPGKNWLGFAKKIDVIESRKAFNRANAEIDHFNSSVKIKADEQNTAHGKLSALMDDTAKLLLDLNDLMKNIDACIPQLDEDIKRLESSNSNDIRDEMHCTIEAKNILISKKSSFSVLQNSLILQLTQVKQLMTQQHKKMLQYQDIASVTLPLWRNHALSCIPEQSNSIDIAAQSSFNEIHKNIFSN